MPELPEVETIRRDLQKLIIGKKVVKVEVRVLRMVQPANFSQILLGRKIEKIERRAKLLIFYFSGGLIMLVHLKMTGQLVFGSLPSKFSHVIFTFSDKSNLLFNDVRRFGYLKIIKVKDLQKIKSAYGIEPLTPEFTLKNFTAVLGRRPKLKIKQLLMNQELIAGLGNIYSDEACFSAGLKPQRLAGSLKKEEIKKLFLEIIKVLKKSLKKRGTSSENYVDAYGQKGGFVPFLAVYGRAGEKCLQCQNKLEKLKIGGRTSVFCSQCQK